MFSYYQCDKVWGYSCSWPFSHFYIFNPVHDDCNAAPNPGVVRALDPVPGRIQRFPSICPQQRWILLHSPLLSTTRPSPRYTTYTHSRLQNTGIIIAYTSMSSSSSIECRFGYQCHRSDCYFSHPQGRAIESGTQSNLPAAAASNATNAAAAGNAVPCRFGRACHRADW